MAKATDKTRNDEATVIDLLAELNEVDVRGDLLGLPAEARAALDLGLSVVAIGQALAMNPDWVAQAREDTGDAGPLSIGPDDLDPLAIPLKLWRVIETTRKLISWRT